MSPGFDHLPIACRPHDVAEAFPIGQVRFGLDGEVPACVGESVIDACRATANDHQVVAVSFDKAVNNPLGQLCAAPMSIARDKDTHVQIIAGEKIECQNTRRPPGRRQFCFQFEVERRAGWHRAAELILEREEWQPRRRA